MRLEYYPFLAYKFFKMISISPLEMGVRSTQLEPLYTTPCGRLQVTRPTRDDSVSGPPEPDLVASTPGDGNCRPGEAHTTSRSDLDVIGTESCPVSRLLPGVMGVDLVQKIA